MAKITPAYRQAALRQGIVVKSNTAHTTDQAVLYAASIELANLGFIVAPEALSGFSSTNLKTLIEDARKLIGADRAMDPIYPGFPKQVQELSTLTLLVEQIMHYISSGTLLPNYPKEVRPGLPLEDMLKHARKLTVASAADAAKLFVAKLVTSSIALSEADKELLKGALELSHPTLNEVVAILTQAHHGENAQSFLRFVTELKAFSENELLQAAIPAASNVDQLLRTVLQTSSSPAEEKWAANYKLAVENLSDSNYRAVRMKRISRPVRRELMARLGELSKGFYADRLTTRIHLWRKIMRAVHPYDLGLSEEAKRAADIIHSNVEHRTFNSLVESAMEKKDVPAAVKLLAENQPGNLLRRVVSILRLVETEADAKALAKALKRTASAATLPTLISAYNGVLSANSLQARVTRVAGLNNALVARDATAQVSEGYLQLTLKAIKNAMKAKLAESPAPVGVVGVNNSSAVPLVRRDLSSGDRQLERGEKFSIFAPEKPETLRVFGHWVNNQKVQGYMDVGVAVLNSDFTTASVCTWNSWPTTREWSTYSGDKLVYPTRNAAEFIDVDLKELKKAFPDSEWLAMTIQSYSGWPIADVNFIAGAMMRSEPNSGEVFDPRSVVTAFKPSTKSTQAVPFAVNLKTGEFVWVDSSNGATEANQSASNDSTIGSIVYDEIVRPRFTLGELAKLWAKAHNAPTAKTEVDVEAVLKLL